MKNKTMYRNAVPIVVGLLLAGTNAFGTQIIQMSEQDGGNFIQPVENPSGPLSPTATYVQNFDGIASGLPTGWTVSSNATATSLGSQNATFISTATSWGDTNAGFKNVASFDGLIETSTAAQQAASTDRDLGLRQTGSFADPGAAINFEFSSVGAQISSISFSLDMLSVQSRSTTFTIQYGIGPNPTSFTTLGTYSDPGLFSRQNFTFTTADFGTNLDNQSDVIFRIVALSASTGTGSRDTIGLDDFSLTTSVGTIQPIPEPATVAMMLLGAGVLASTQRFRRKAN